MLAQLRNVQLYLDGFLNLAHILHRKNTSAPEEPSLADGSQLIRYGLALFPFKNHDSLARIKAGRLAREGHDLHPIEKLVGGVVADDDGRAPLSDLPTNGRIEINPPDLTAFH